MKELRETTLSVTNCAGQLERVLDAQASGFAEFIQVRALVIEDEPKLLPRMMERPVISQSISYYMIGMNERAEKVAQSAMQKASQPSLSILYFEPPSISSIVSSVKVAFKGKSTDSEFTVSLGLITPNSTNRTWTVHLHSNRMALRLELRGFRPEEDSEIIAAFISTLEVSSIFISSDMGDGELDMFPISEACCNPFVRSIRIDSKTPDAQLIHLVNSVRYMPKLERVYFNGFGSKDYGSSLYESIHRVLADDPNGHVGHGNLVDCKIEVLSHLVNMRSMSEQNPHEIEFYLVLNERGYRHRLLDADTKELIAMVANSFQGDIFDRFDVSAAYYLLRHDPAKWC